MTEILLPMIEPAPGKIAFQCPACLQYRPGFVFTNPTIEEAVELDLPEGVEWICDNERSLLLRNETALSESLQPPPERRFTKPEFMDLWTPGETVAVMQSSDTLLAYFWARTLAWDGYFLLSDTRVGAGVTKAEQLGILTAARATRLRAGLQPE